MISPKTEAAELQTTITEASAAEIIMIVDITFRLIHHRITLGLHDGFVDAHILK